MDRVGEVIGHRMVLDIQVDQIMGEVHAGLVFEDRGFAEIMIEGNTIGEPILLNQGNGFAIGAGHHPGVIGWVANIVEE